MERRAFLRLLQRGFLGSLALSFGPAVLPAFAVDPATVVLLVNTAISVAKLFSQGPGIGDQLEKLDGILREVFQKDGVPIPKAEDPLPSILKP